MTEITSTIPQTGAERVAEWNDTQRAIAAKRRAEQADRNETALLEKYPNIDEVVERGLTGPTRVVINCDDPQTKQGVVICTGLREIAVQDAFQVHRCLACQTYVTAKGRRARQAERDRELRALARTLRAAKEQQ